MESKKNRIIIYTESFEESLEHFSKAAFFCEKENIKSVSASIMCVENALILEQDLSYIEYGLG